MRRHQIQPILRHLHFICLKAFLSGTAMVTVAAKWVWEKRPKEEKKVVIKIYNAKGDVVREN
jgi:hypothetical protein